MGVLCYPAVGGRKFNVLSAQSQQGMMSIRRHSVEYSQSNAQHSSTLIMSEIIFKGGFRICHEIMNAVPHKPANSKTKMNKRAKLIWFGDSFEMPSSSNRLQF